MPGHLGIRLIISLFQIYQSEGQDKDNATVHVKQWWEFTLRHSLLQYSISAYSLLVPIILIILSSEENQDLDKFFLFLLVQVLLLLTVLMQLLVNEAEPSPLWSQQGTSCHPAIQSDYYSRLNRTVLCSASSHSVTLNYLFQCQCVVQINSFIYLFFYYSFI